ncbi:hypothetical protein ACE193_02850 [Bernardetia sp. OM2101]|uniref:hypothetical protein n=1 Tax=Bernardetia sp. OM2101 TaxID=3344876 RepID=UPI0035D0BFC4
MKNQKAFHFNLKSILYLSLLGTVLSFSAFSCEVYEPLEIRIENKTGYDLTEIRADKLEISSLRSGQISNYTSLEDFRYLRGVSVVVSEKFKRGLSSEYKEINHWGWCGTGLTDEDYKRMDQASKADVLKSGKHTFVLTIEKGVDGEILYFEKK